MNRLRPFLLTIVFLMTGCDQQAWFDKFVPKDEAEFSKHLISEVASRDFAAIDQQLDESLKGPDLRGKLDQIADQFPSSDAVDVQMVGAQSYTSPQRAQYSLTFQYRYPEKWLLANVVLYEQGGRIRVAGIHVNTLRDSLQNLNRFTLTGKGAVNFVFLAFAIAVPILIIAALVSCIRTPVARRKWLWVLFILFGVVQFSLNWTNGAVDIKPVSLLLFGAGLWRAGPAAPYVLTVAIPLGSILFFVRRLSWRPQGPANDSIG